MRSRASRSRAAELYPVYFVTQLQVELSFATGQIINVYGEMDDDGFYMGEIDGVRGLVPSNFLTEAPEQYGAGQTSQAQGSMGRGQRGGRGIGPGARGPPPPPRDNTGRNRKQGIPERGCRFAGLIRQGRSLMQRLDLSSASQPTSHSLVSLLLSCED